MSVPYASWFSVQVDRGEEGEHVIFRRIEDVEVIGELL